MKQTGRFKKIFIALTVAVLLVGLGYGASRAMKGTDKTPSKAADAPIMVPGNFTELAENVRNGVVNIQAVKNGKSGGRVFRHFFGNPRGHRNPFEDFLGPEFGWNDQIGRAHV
jgi:hypothetical protein